MFGTWKDYDQSDKERNGTRRNAIERCKDISSSTCKATIL